MQVDDAFPRAVREIENAWIPMPDGARLAARIWLPADAGEAPVPGILEYIPYRKREFTAARDVPHHAWMAGQGYACVRVDLRGSGESDGVLTDEYLQRELDDGVTVIEWIAAQPWCTGKVGMIGISWGGFNGLQIAALRPAALAAVVTLCFTDDRYADDVHYMGGCLLGENLSWATTMLSYNTCPPDPAIVGERWREMWLERLDRSGLWLETWLRHQRRDDYWRHGSVCEDFDAIRCPVLAVSGWADGYPNAVFRLLAGLSGPRRGLVGPWSHLYPHVGVPGPAIGFLQEALRWWDHWLKGEDRGAMDEPMVRVWMQASAPPAAGYAERPGRWVAEPGWPSERVETREWHLAGRRLAIAPGAGEALALDSPLGSGLHGGKWCAYGHPPDLPVDQRPDDAGAAVFDTDPLEHPLEILGAPVAVLDIEADAPVALIAVRLSDVAPDGAATRVSYGLLNLTHRDGHAHPAPLAPGHRYRVRVQMKDIAQRFSAGHRVRLSVASDYWPVAWPPPVPVRLTLHTGASVLQLPSRAARPDDAKLREFEPPRAGPPLRRTVIEKPRLARTLHRDLATGETTLEVVNDEGAWRVDDIDLEVAVSAVERYAVRGDDPASARAEARWTRRFRRAEWSLRTEARTVLTSDATRFMIDAAIEAFEGDERVFSREWRVAIPRDLV